MAAVDIGMIITGTNNASGAIQGASADVKTLGENAQATANRLKAIQVVIAGIVLEKGLEIGKSLFEAAAASQVATLQLATFSGGMANAMKISDDLRDKLGAVFPMENIKGAEVKFLAVGVSLSSAEKLTVALGDAIAAMPVKDKAGELDNLSTAFERMGARGYATSRELSTSLTGTGVEATEVAKTMGITYAAFVHKLAIGHITAASFIAAFTRTAEEKYGGMAHVMNFTLGGAVQQFQNRFEESMQIVTTKTDVLPRLTATINNLADATAQWMASINQGDIDNFFHTMEEIVPVATTLVGSLRDVAKTTQDIATNASHFLNMLPSDATEYGIIGYVLGGKKLALLGGVLDGIITKLDVFNAKSNDKNNFMNSAMIGGAMGSKFGLIGAAIGAIAGGASDLALKKLKDVDTQYNEIEISAYKAGMTSSQFFEKVQSMPNSGPGLAILDVYRRLGGEDGVFSDAFYGKHGAAALKASLVATKAQAVAVAAGLAGIPKPRPEDGSGEKPGADPTAKIAALKVATEDLLQNMGDQVTTLLSKASGDTLQTSMDALSHTTDGWLRQLNDAYTRWLNIKGVSEAFRSAVLAVIAKQQVDIANATGAEAYHLEKINDAKKQEIALDTQLVAAQQAITNATLATNLAMLKSHESAFVSGTAGGQVQLQVMQQQLQYTNDIAAAMTKIQQLKNAAAANPNDTTLLAHNKAEVAGLQNQIKLTNQLKIATTQAGVIMKNAFSEAGQVLENDVTNGITGLITHTETLGQAMKQIFTDMIGLVIKYMVQMAEMFVMSKIQQVASTATSAPNAAATAAMWAPAAMAASIATFGGADIAGAAGFQSAMLSSLIPFAMGGVPGLGDFSNSVLTGPTVFGLAGEAGDEAVMPLTRVNGKLGVRTEGGGGNHFHFHSADPESNVKFFMKNMHIIDSGLAQHKRLNRGSR